jgi:hypothetical protein
MSYSHQQVERLVANRVDLATDTSYFLAPGYQPIILRAVAVVITTATATSSITVTVTRRVTAGSNTGETAVTTVTVPVSTAQGTVIYKDGLDQKVMPGEELEFLVGGTGTGNGDIIAYFEPSWDMPGNNSDMIATA